MEQKIILSDADGVLLNWVDAFHDFMKAHAKRRTDIDTKHYYHIDQQYEDLERAKAKFLVRIFNESAHIGYLPAFRDSVHYVKLLHEKHGYKFRIITSLGTNEYAVKLREMNLRNLFGDAIDTVTCLPIGAAKDDELEKYKDTGLYWVEDHPHNFEAGLDFGLNSILLDHGYNRTTDKTRGHHATNWAEIYDLITA